MIKSIVTKKLEFYTSPEDLDKAVEQQDLLNQNISRYFNNPFITVDKMTVEVTLEISQPEGFNLEELD